MQTKTSQALPAPNPVSATGVPCVLAGTLIATQRGEIPVEHLVAGDRVVSRDRGLVPVRWVGAITADARTTPDAAPVKIPKGAMGRNVPARDLYTAPDQRLWLRGAAFKDLFATSEVLVPARDLVGWNGITQVSYVPAPTYFLVLFDQTEIIVADGLQIESVHPGAALDGFSCTVRDAMLALFPQLTNLVGTGRPLRRRLTRGETRRAVTRHQTR